MKFSKELNAEFFKRRREFKTEILFVFLISLTVLTQASYLGKSLHIVFFNTSDALSHSLFALGCAVAVRVFLQFFRELNTNHLAHKVSANLRIQIAQHMFDLRGNIPPSFSPGVLSNLQDSKPDSVEPYFRAFLPAALNAIAIPLAIAVFAFWYDPLSGVVFLITGPLIPFFAALIGMTAQNAAQKQWSDLDRLAKQFSDFLRGWDTIRLFGAEKRTVESVRESGLQYKNATLRILRIAFLSAFSLEFVATLSTAILAVEIGLRVMYGHMDYQKAITLLLLAPEYYLPLRNLGGAFHASVSGIEAMADIRCFLELEVPYSACKEKLDTKSIPQSWKTISIDNANLGYSTREQPVLENISVTINKGDRIALKGSSGSGKTTFCQTLLGNISPLAGTVTLDSTPCQNFSASQWSQLFTTIPQQPTLAATTILSNICLGREQVNNSTIMEVCSLAGLVPLINALPLGLKTPVGENGITLSTGQAHRIALARTFLSNAPIVILDEPTAHLDPETEKIVSDGISILSKNRTLIVISHRESTLAQCTRTLHFSNSAIQELCGDASS